MTDSLSIPSVSVVIATADRPSIVCDCLHSIGRQLPEDVEVIIVDAGKAHPVDERSAKEAWGNTRVLCSTIRNAGSQRNLGVREAHGEIIIFLDDDTYVQLGWWPRIIEPLLNDRRPTTDNRRPTGNTPSTKNRERRTGSRGIGAVAGAVWCNPSPEFTDKCGGYVNWRGEPVQVTHRSADAPRWVDWPMTTNMAVRKCVMDEIGGVPSVYGVYDEDVDLGLKIRRAGWGIYFQPEAAVYHYYRERPARPPTKRTEYVLGRNRSILLVRHFGLSLRLLAFLTVTPWLRLGAAFRSIVQHALTSLGHAGSYVIGMLAGLVVGVRNPVDEDQL